MPDDDQPPTGGTPGGTPPAGTPPNPPPASPPPAPPAQRVVGNGGDIPPERVSEVKAAERRKLLKELYGTDDEEAVARIRKEHDDAKAKLKTHEEEAEKKRLADMSELDRVKEELRLEREKSTKREQELTAERDTHKSQLEMERQDKVVSGIASKYVSPKHVRYAMSELGAHIDGLTKTELKSFGQKQIDDWFKGFVKENPDYKLAAAAPPAPPPASPPAGGQRPQQRPAAPPPKRAPVGSRGAPPARSPAPPPNATGPGTFKGKPIAQLNRQELDEYYSKTTGRKKPY